MPKFGFTSPNRVEYNGVNLDTLQALVDNKKLKSKVAQKDLMDNGLVQKNDLVKILGRASNISSAISATDSAWLSEGSGIPPASI